MSEFNKSGNPGSANNLPTTSVLSRSQIRKTRKRELIKTEDENGKRMKAPMETVPAFGTLEIEDLKCYAPFLEIEKVMDPVHWAQLMEFINGQQNTPNGYNRNTQVEMVQNSKLESEHVFAPPVDLFSDEPVSPSHGDISSENYTDYEGNSTDKVLLTNERIATNTGESSCRVGTKFKPTKNECKRTDLNEEDKEVLTNILDEVKKSLSSPTKPKNKKTNKTERHVLKKISELQQRVNEMTKIKDFLEDYWKLLDLFHGATMDTRRKVYGVLKREASLLAGIVERCGHCCIFRPALKVHQHYCEDNCSMSEYYIALSDYEERGIQLKYFEAFCKKHYFSKKMKKSGKSFVNRRISNSEYEGYVTCKCGREWHVTCAMVSNKSENFTCPNCQIDERTPQQIQRYKAASLPHTELSEFLEEFVMKKMNEHPRTHTLPINKITIRVVSNTKKKSEVQEEFRDMIGDYPESLEYMEKAIFAFQEIDGEDVAIFSLRTQEYFGELPEAMQNMVNISYIDSVRYFEPAARRTDFYKQIILGYFDFIRRYGYTRVHIWAQPPKDGDDYIFWSHPPEQVFPEEQKLVEWYESLFDAGMENSVVKSYKKVDTNDINDQFGNLPYCDGGIWSETIEQCFEIWHNQEKLKEPKEPKRNPRKENEELQNDTEKNMSEKDLLKKNYFVDWMNQMIELKHTFNVNLAPLDTSKNHRDPTPVMSHPLMDDRTIFVLKCKSENWEFVNLRHAKYTTWKMLQILLNETPQLHSSTQPSCSSSVVASQPFHGAPLTSMSSHNEMLAIESIADSLDPQRSWPEGKKFDSETPLICEILVPENGVFRNKDWKYKPHLDERLQYSFTTFIEETDLFLYSFQNGQFRQSSTPCGQSLRTTQIIAHPHGTQSGHCWKKTGIDFSFIKFTTRSPSDGKTFKLDYGRRYCAFICMTVSDGSSTYPEQRMKSADFIVVREWQHHKAEKFAPENAETSQDQKQRKRDVTRSSLEPDAKKTKQSEQSPESPKSGIEDGILDGNLRNGHVAEVSEQNQLADFSVPAECEMKQENEEEEEKNDNMDGADDLDHVHTDFGTIVSRKKIEISTKFFSENYSEVVKLILEKCTTADVKNFFKTVRNLRVAKKDQINETTLDTIKKKLDEKTYKEPTEIRDEFFKCFYGVISKREKTNKTKLKKCLKVHDEFVMGMDAMFKEYGYCCSQGYGVQPKIFYCESDGRQITDDYLMLYVQEANEGRITVDEVYTYCPTHEGEIKTFTIDGEPRDFEKQSLTGTSFDRLEECVYCKRKWHTACAMQYSSNFVENFVCITCRSERNKEIISITFFARNLPEDHLSKHIESHIREVLKKQKKDPSSVFIRVLSSTKMQYDVDSLVKKEYNCSSGTIGYWSRVIFAFQIVNGREVAIFGLRVQEYGEDAPESMRNLVNISYLDSVRVIDSKEQRIKIFQQIVISYMQFAGRRNFKKVHIWSRPPAFGEDYIFFSHPVTQIYPTQASLDKWYCALFEEGMGASETVANYKKIAKVKSITEIPLCEDGFIMTLMEEKKYTNENIGELFGDVNMKLGHNSLFEIELKIPDVREIKKDNAPIDVPIRSDLFAKQPTFLTKARKEKWYFSSLQEAKYSTFAFVRELFTNDGAISTNQVGNRN